MRSVVFYVLLPLQSLSTEVPSIHASEQSLSSDITWQSWKKHHGIIVIPWQMLVSTKANLSGWLVTAAWACERLTGIFLRHLIALSFPFYFHCLAGVSLCLLLFPWPIRGVCSTQMGSSKNLLSDLVFSKHMYTESFWRFITRPNVGAFSQEQQITYLITRQLSLPSCKSTLKGGFIRAYQWTV